MKRETYTYNDEQADVSLSFSFPVGDKLELQKRAFLVLLEQAIAQITKELG